MSTCRDTFPHYSISMRNGIPHHHSSFQKMPRNTALFKVHHQHCYYKMAYYRLLARWAKVNFAMDYPKQPTSVNCNAKTSPPFPTRYIVQIPLRKPHQERSAIPRKIELNFFQEIYINVYASILFLFF